MATKIKSLPPEQMSSADLVQSLAKLTDAQFDYWLDQLNEALASLGIQDYRFNRNDHRAKTISYWYVVGEVVVAALRAQPQLGQLKDYDKASSQEVLTPLSVKQLYIDVQRYERETIRRFLSELKKHRLVTTAGKGEDALLKLPRATIAAYLNTVRRWVKEFGDWQEKASASARELLS